MPKAYWMSLRIQINDQEKFQAYAAKAGPAIAAGGGKFLARGGRVKTLEGYEQGRVVIIEFPDFDTALKIQSNNALALVGRGVVKSRTGEPTDGSADLNGARYSTCSPDAETWALEASEIRLDHRHKLGHGQTVDRTKLPQHCRGRADFALL